jgi:hypothetical protein
MLLKLGGLFFVVSLIFWLWAIFDSITSAADRVRNLPKIAWVIIVLIFLEVGALAWLLLGRPREQTGSGRTSGFRSIPGPRPRSGPIGPDDDPDFLGKI